MADQAEDSHQYQEPAPVAGHDGPVIEVWVPGKDGSETHHIFPADHDPHGWGEFRVLVPPPVQAQAQPHEQQSSAEHNGIIKALGNKMLRLYTALEAGIHDWVFGDHRTQTATHVEATLERMQRDAASEASGPIPAPEHGKEYESPFSVEEQDRMVREIRRSAGILNEREADDWRAAS